MRISLLTQKESKAKRFPSPKVNSALKTIFHAIPPHINEMPEKRKDQQNFHKEKYSIKSCFHNLNPFMCKERVGDLRHGKRLLTTVHSAGHAVLGKKQINEIKSSSRAEAKRKKQTEIALTKQCTIIFYVERRSGEKLLRTNVHAELYFFHTAPERNCQQ